MMKEQMIGYKRSIILLICVLFLCLGFSGVPVYAAEDIENRTGIESMEEIYTGQIDASQIYNKKASAAYQSKWESYSTYYYYNQMSNEEKKFYDELNNMCLSYLTGNDDFDTYVSNKLISKYVPIGALSFDKASEILRIFIYSNPQYYFIDLHYGLSTRNGANYIAPGVFEEFRDGTDRKKVTDQLAVKINEYYSQIDLKASELEKQIALHNLLVQNVTYEFGDFDQSIYSVFFQNETVCAGYAKAFELLCNGIGIDCVAVTSKVHAWNKVRINDSWYVVDSTWNDLDDEREMRYTYFNRSNEVIDKIDSTGQHKEEPIWEGYGPECLIDSGATYDSVGDVYEPDNQVEDPSIKMTYKDGYIKVELTSTNKDAMLYYTLNGTNPSEATSKSLRYNGSFTVKAKQTLKVIATCNGFTDSRVITKVVDVKASSAAKPVIVTNPASKSYTYGSKATALKVVISPVNMTSVSYQWYVKTSTNGKATLIKGATKATYTPPVSKAGTLYYFCKVANKDNNALVTKVVYQQSATAKIVVKQASISSCKITKIANKTYTGKAQLQSPTITYKGKVLVNNKDYTLSYKANKAIGKAQCIIKGKGNFSGKKTYSFTINPKGTTIASTKKKSRNVTLKWKKNSEATGYQIQYSYSSKFSSNKTNTVKKNKSTSYTLKSLQKKTCYIRIRTYKKTSSGTYYSSWSKVVKIKIK